MDCSLAEAGCCVSQGCVQLTYTATKLVRFAQPGKHPSIPQCFVLQEGIPQLSASLPKLYYCHSDSLVVFFWLNICLFLKYVYILAIWGQYSKSEGRWIWWTGWLWGDCLAYRHQCGLKEHWRCSSVYISEKARQTSMPTESKVKVVFRKWHPYAEEQHFPV